MKTSTYPKSKVTNRQTNHKLYLIFYLTDNVKQYFIHLVSLAKVATMYFSTISTSNYVFITRLITKSIPLYIV